MGTALNLYHILQMEFMRVITSVLAEKVQIGENFKHKATDSPDVDGGRPRISEGDFGGAD